MNSTEPYGLGLLGLPKHLERDWRWVLAVGVALAILGLLVIAVPQAFTMAVSTRLACALLAVGVGQLCQPVRETGWKNFTLDVVGSMIYIIGGLAVAVSSPVGTLALSAMLAGFFAVDGSLRILGALRTRPIQGWWIPFTSGSFAILIGLMMWLARPDSPVWILEALVGVMLIWTGGNAVAYGLAAKLSTQQAASTD